MRDNGKEDAVGCEITRKRTLGKEGGADKRGGAHSRYQFFRCGKIGGGRINDGGRSGSTLRYIPFRNSAYTARRVRAGQSRKQHTQETVPVRTTPQGTSVNSAIHTR